MSLIKKLRAYFFSFWSSQRKTTSKKLTKTLENHLPRRSSWNISFIQKINLLVFWVRSTFQKQASLLMWIAIQLVTPVCLSIAVVKATTFRCQFVCKLAGIVCSVLQLRSSEIFQPIRIENKFGPKLPPLNQLSFCTV